MIATSNLRTSPAGRRSGITLLEVLLSMAIFLFSLAAIGQLVDYGADRGMDARMQTIGMRLAQSKMAEAEAGVVAVDTESTGTFDEEPEWNWTLVPGQPVAPNLYQVTITVWKEFSGRKFEVKLTQMIFDPAQMGAATAAQPPATNSAGTTTTTTATTGGTGS